VRYLNFYGHRELSKRDLCGRLETWSGQRRATKAEVRDKTAIIGYVDFTPAQRDDHYPTVYTTTDGVKLSGSEISQTDALANLGFGQPA